MDLVDIRKQFIKTSGRHDLVLDDETYADDGANFIINSAQRYLDRLLMDGHLMSKATVSKALNVGDYYTTFTLCRSLEIARIIKADGSVLQLLPYALDIIKRYYEKQLSKVEPGTPAYFARTSLRFNPHSTPPGSTSDDFFVSSPQGFNAIIWQPPCLEACSLELEGYFYNPELSLDTDESFWTVGYPDTLIKAALRELEVYNRNTEGQKDYERAIQQDLFAINCDFIEDELKSDGGMEMNG